MSGHGKGNFMRKLPVNVAKMYALHARMSMNAIGEKYGCSRQAVSEWFQARGGKKVDHRYSDNEKILKILKCGYSASKTAEICKCHPATVYRAVKKHGIKLPPQPEPEGYKYLKDKKWLNKRYIGWRWTIDDISADLGCSTTAVRKWLKEHQISIRKRGRPHKLAPLPDFSKRIRL